MRSKLATLAGFTLATVLTILIDRYVSTPLAVVVGVACATFLTWNHWKEIRVSYQELRSLLREKWFRVTAAILLALVAVLGACLTIFYHPEAPPLLVLWKPSAPTQDWAATQKIDTTVPLRGPEGKLIRVNAEPAEVDAALVNPAKLSIISSNVSGQTAWDIRYQVVLWNLDEDRNQNFDTVLSLPNFSETYKGNFLKPKDHYLPRSIVDQIETGGRVRRGNRLVGYASVGCSNCKRDHFYWIYYEYQISGWYSPVPLGAQPDITLLSKQIPAIAQSPEYFFRDIAKSNRKPVEQFHLY